MDDTTMRNIINEVNKELEKAGHEKLSKTQEECINHLFSKVLKYVSFEHLAINPEEMARSIITDGSLTIGTPTIYLR